VQEYNEIEQGQKYQGQNAESQVKPVCLFLQKGADNGNKMKRSLLNSIKKSVFPGYFS
jgi:hypothetical protein